MKYYYSVALYKTAYWNLIYRIQDDDASYYFFSVCSERFYGNDCNTPCGHCSDNDVCNNVTGVCPNGCRNQWIEDKCDGEFQINFNIR